MNNLRPFEWDDLEKMVELLAACEEVDQRGSVPTAEGLRHQFATPGINAEKYVWVLPAADGRLTAMCVGVPVPGHDVDMVQVAVDVRPESRKGGLQEKMLRFVEERSREMAVQTGKRYVLSAYTNSSQENYIRLYEEAGFTPARWFLQLERDLKRPITKHALPDGIRVRSLELDADVESLHYILDDSFRDHWNPPNFTAEQLAHWFHSPKFRSDLVLLAFGENDEPAGVCVSALRDEYNAQHNTREGYVSALGVRRPFRGRGLARALLTRNLTLLKKAGMNTAVLDVDSQNPTGATRLYESVGFTERKRSVVYQKELRGESGGNAELPPMPVRM